MPENRKYKAKNFKNSLKTVCLFVFCWLVLHFKELGKKRSINLGYYIKRILMPQSNQTLQDCKMATETIFCWVIQLI